MLIVNYMWCQTSSSLLISLRRVASYCYGKPNILATGLWQTSKKQQATYSSLLDKLMHMLLLTTWNIGNISVPFWGTSLLFLMHMFWNFLSHHICRVATLARTRTFDLFTKWNYYDNIQTWHNLNRIGTKIVIQSFACSMLIFRH